MTKDRSSAGVCVGSRMVTLHPTTNDSLELIAAASFEKRNIGARLQEVSEGDVLFLWAELARGGGVAQQIDTAVAR